ncbi:YciI family protein [Paracoccus aerodenitrificans]|uniref:YciI family protein n=1 Tax=Paracoccus aerodenitrificans TaxID=3017781 RepID=UPI0022F0579C|nr:YciI family protein [Paracoccus aerodenitrificans]WBU64524.1 YciI family protein [Paracoccus aerodenitrificans]
MPYFAVICKDKDGGLPLRQENRPAHLDYIEQTGIVFMAGPLLEDGNMAGSLVILDAPDLAAAEAWAEGDPYARAGLFDSVSIREWKKVIG